MVKDRACPSPNKSFIIASNYSHLYKRHANIYWPSKSNRNLCDHHIGREPKSLSHNIGGFVSAHFRGVKANKSG